MKISIVSQFENLRLDRAWVAAALGVKASGAAGLNVLGSGLLFGNRQVIIERTAELGLPAIYQ
jgi:hypothetical protein